MSKRSRSRVLGVVALVGALVAVGVVGTSPPRGAPTNVIVVERHPGTEVAERAVERLGGRIGAGLPVVDGFAATVPSGAIQLLGQTAGVRAVLPDVPFRLDAKPGGSGGGGGGAPAGAVYAQAVDAPKTWAGGYKGKVGVNVALVDSGIAQIDDLTKPSNRIAGWKDFVSGSSTPVDPHGHGTYVAGIVAGNGTLSAGKWAGIAPEAGVIGIRVFDALGVSTSSKIVQGIQWAIANKTAYGIRVLNLAFSTNSDLSYKLDAVTYAAEQAWRAGIVVVASAGNLGPLPGTVLSPGIDPYLVTVGAVDDRGTAARTDDTVALWSGRGPSLLDRVSKPDLVAPGVWDTGLRVPLSTVDLEHPLSVRDTYYFDGSGTSPATGVVSGVVALMLQKRPKLVPDQVKYVLTHTATSAPSTDPNVVGAGYVNAYDATFSGLTAKANQGLVPAIGGGLLSLTGVPDVKWR